MSHEARSPIEFVGTADEITDRIKTPSNEIEPVLLAKLGEICAVSISATDRIEHARDWWPLAMHWSLNGMTTKRPSAVCRPKSTQQVSQIVALCANSSIPVTVSGGRSGVCGAAVPLFAGVVIDTTDLCGVVSVDKASGLVEVLPGTFGPDLESQINAHQLTVGHFPQSFEISTVGGWIGSRGAGQFSTRYGKIDEMVAGLEVVLADGSIILTGTEPAGAVGPNLTSLFVGSEGTLGIITRVWLRAHPLPAVTKKLAFSFKFFSEAVETMRTAVRTGATPAVLRLYDERESKRSHGGDGTNCILLVLDEGVETLVDATLKIVADCATANNGTPADEQLVDNWLTHRNDTSGLQILSQRGFVIDTMEVATAWSRVNQVADSVKNAIMQVAGARSATCHISHSYIDGACIYFTFVAEPKDKELASIELTYLQVWDAAQNAALNSGANLTHHHGVGINRAKYIQQALGSAHKVLRSIKAALDPHEVLNPGKLGIASRRGEFKI